MLHTYSRAHFPAGVLLSNRPKSRTSFPWIKVLLLLVAALLAVALLGLIHVAASAGDLDPAFGTGGKVVTDFRTGVPDQAIGVTLQPDGKIIAVGATGMQPIFDNPPGINDNLGDFAVARYNSDGSLDATFGNGGRVTTDFFGFRDMAFSVKVQTDGKIVVAGYASRTGTDIGDDFALARYNGDGTLDSGFGSGGKVTTDFFGKNDGANNVILLPGGRIIAVGNACPVQADDDFGLAGYNADGSLDTSFGNGGKVTTDFGSQLKDIAIGAVFASGKIVVVGPTKSGLFDGNSEVRPNSFGAGDFGIARYNLDGSLDSSFGGTGIVSTDIAGGEDLAVATVVQPDGKIIVAGTAGSVSLDFAIVRYNATGSLDTSFGSGGKVLTDFGVGTGHEIAFSLLLQPNGKIVANGVVGLNIITTNKIAVETHAQFGLARYSSNGTLDPTFGTGGKITTEFFGMDGFAMGSALQTDGKMVVVGSVYTSAVDSRFALARYSLKTPQVIAFVSNRDGNEEIYIMNADGSAQARLTNNPAQDTQPSLSADADWIVFMSTRDENEEIYLMNADGSAQTRLTNGVYSDRFPSFSHDGKKIVFSSFRDGNQEIYVMNADGTDQTRLTNNAAIDDQPAFSPDGSKIAFESWRDGNCEIYLMNADGSSQTRLTSVAPFLDEHPSFSQDGKKIAFLSGRNGYPDVYLMNVDGTNESQLTNLPGFDDNPSFSPNGDQIAFRSDRNGNSEIYLMNIDGSGATRLTTNSAADNLPSWGGPPLSTFQFGVPTYSVGEDCAGVTITVTRGGDLNHPATVDFATGDRNATQRTDYNIGAGTLTFAAGETSKTFTVLANEDHYLEGTESFDVILENPSEGAGIGTQREAVITIMDGDSGPPTTNPNDDAALFVCQHYHDFLSRQADPSGAAYWTGRISECGADPTCLRNRRLDVSNAFFYEQEFQDTGAYVYRVYKMTYGAPPAYSQFMPDRSRVVGGAQLDQSKLDFAEAFVRRTEFTAQFPTSLVPDAFVEGLNANTGNVLSAAECDVLANGIQNGTETRGTVLRKLADDPRFINAEYNASFVLTQYFGYLRRDPDQGGFNFWLGQVNLHPIRDVGIQHAMVCSFITSREYQERFSSVVLHSNAECPQ